MARRRLKPEQRRAQILEAARRLFVEGGYEGTRVEDILGELSLSKGGFYHHFASKDEVLEALVREELGDWLARFAGLELLEPRVGLEALFRRGSTWLSPWDSVYATLRGEESRERFLRLVERTIEGPLRRVLHSLLERGVEAGVFRAKYPIGLIVELAIGLNNHGNACIFRGLWEEEELIEYIEANLDILEDALGIVGHFASLREAFAQGVRQSAHKTHRAANKARE